MQRNIKNYEDWVNFPEFVKHNSKTFNRLELAEYFNCSAGYIGTLGYRHNVQEHIRDFYKISFPEMQFKQLLDRAGFQLDVDYVLHDRRQIKPLELDFYFPKLKLAVVYSDSSQINGN